ncbi:MAG: type IV secretion system protein [Nakamurella sp.]
MSDHYRVVAFSLNPLDWLGDAASSAVGDVWKAAMTGLWSAAIWILKLAFKLIDSFTEPNLSADGPMRGILPTTLWIGATVAVIMMFVQLLVALLRRDGESMGKVVLGICQFGLVWAGYLGVAAGLVAAASGLTKGILDSMLHVQTFSGYNFSESWPHSIQDVTLATVLGVLSILLVIPAAFVYVLIMLVREAALIILVATAPISAGGLLAEAGKVWFWKTTRWFFSCLLISPCAALLLGIGVQLSDGAINRVAPFPQWCAQNPGQCNGDPVKALAKWGSLANANSAGMAIVGCIVIAIGALCPLILFRLLAFVEPGTASGASLRQSWSDTGGMSGVLRGGESTGSSAALRSGTDGRSSGESGAEAQTGGRLAAAMGAFGAGTQLATSIAHRAADIGSDVLGSAGVGSPGYSMTPTDQGFSRRSRRGGNGSSEQPSGEVPEQPTPPPPDPAPSGSPLPFGGAPVAPSGSAAAAAPTPAAVP